MKITSEDLQEAQRLVYHFEQYPKPDLMLQIVIANKLQEIVELLNNARSDRYFVSTGKK